MAIKTTYSTVKKPPTSRTLQAQKTRQTIFDTALQMFAKYGYEDVTIDDIARNAHVSKGAFYAHFKSKDAVLSQALQNGYLNYERALNDLPSNSTGKEQLKALADATWVQTCDIFGIDLIKILYGNQVSHAKDRPDVLGNKNGVYYKLVRSCIENGMADGSFSKELDVDSSLELVVFFFRSIIVDWCIHNGTTDLRKHAALLFPLILLLLEKPNLLS